MPIPNYTPFFISTNKKFPPFLCDLGALCGKICQKKAPGLEPALSAAEWAQGFSFVLIRVNSVPGSPLRFVSWPNVFKFTIYRLAFIVSR
jgi:hypothetical protein